jgi:hypothetical protein
MILPWNRWSYLCRMRTKFAFGGSEIGRPVVQLIEEGRIVTNDLILAELIRSETVQRVKRGAGHCSPDSALSPAMWRLTL